MPAKCFEVFTSFYATTDSICFEVGMKLSSKVWRESAVEPKLNDDVTPINDCATDRISPSTEFLPGQTLDGRYQIISHLGKGGMGVVYRVNQIFLNKEFALKTIEQHFMTDIVIRRFQQEARTAFALDHPNIIAVNDFGVLDDQTPFLVMELVKGETLGERLKRTGCLTVEEAIPIFVQVCFGLAYAHECGVVHRDIKPNNIMLLSGMPLGAEGSIKILDFGIAKFIEREGGEIQALTRTGEIFGSPLYMSPEQCSGTSVDHRADVYSLGCVLFEALTGAPPCVGESALATMMKHQTEHVLTLKQASLGKDFPQAIEDIVATMLAKSPDHRYKNLGIVAHDLGALKRGESISHTASFHTRQQAKAKTISMASTLLLGIVVLLAAIAVTSGYRTEEARKADQERDNAIFQAEELKVKVAKLQEVLKAKNAVSRKPVKDGGEEYAIFQFPQGEDFGNFDSSVGVQPAASGEVRLAAMDKTTFHANKSFFQNPNNLTVFQPNDLVGLYLTNCIHEQRLASPIMHQIGTLTRLQELGLDQNDGINDGALGEISKLPNLKELSVSDTKIDGAALAQLPNLRQLTLLGFVHCKGASDLLKVLKHDRQLTELYLDKNPLSAGDYKAIGTISGLRILYVNTTGMHNADLSSLTALTKLEELQAKGCAAITADAIPALKIMAGNGLRKLSLSAASSDAYVIRKNLPGVVFEVKDADGDFQKDTDWGDLVRSDESK